MAHNIARFESGVVAHIRNAYASQNYPVLFGLWQGLQRAIRSQLSLPYDKDSPVAYGYEPHEAEVPSRYGGTAYSRIEVAGTFSRASAACGRAALQRLGLNNGCMPEAARRQLVDEVMAATDGYFVRITPLAGDAEPLCWQILRPQPELGVEAVRARVGMRGAGEAQTSYDAQTTTDAAVLQHLTRSIVGVEPYHVTTAGE